MRMRIVKYVRVAFFLSVDRPHHNVARQGPPYPTPPSLARSDPSYLHPPSSTTYHLLSLLLIHNNRQKDNGRPPAAAPNNNMSITWRVGVSFYRHVVIVIIIVIVSVVCRRRSLRIIMECWASFLPTSSQNMGCADVYNNNNTFLIRGVAHQ